MLKFWPLSNIVTGSLVGSCTAEDTDCEAICECFSGYHGPYCEYSYDEYIARNHLRLSVLSGVQSLVSGSGMPSTDVETTSIALSYAAESKDGLTQDMIHVSLARYDAYTPSMI